MTEPVNPTQDPQYAEFLAWKNSQRTGTATASMPAVVPPQDEAKPDIFEVLKGLVHTANLSHEGIVRAWHAAIDDFRADYDALKGAIIRDASEVKSDVLSALTPSDTAATGSNPPVENVGGIAPGASND